MKNRKTAWIIFAATSLIILAAAGCRKSADITDLGAEARFAHRVENVIGIDFLNEETGLYNPVRWSRLHKDGTRYGIYPDSSIAFPVFERRDLFLLTRMRPYLRSDFTASSIRVLLNGGELGELSFTKPGMDIFVLPIPGDMLNTGDNLLTFLYALEEGGGEKEVQNITDRPFSVVLSDLMVSSLSELNEAKTVALMEEKAGEEQGSVFVHQVPGRIDFFLDVPPGAMLDAEAVFCPAEGAKALNQDGKNLNIFCSRPGEEDLTLHTSLLEDLLDKPTRLNLPLPEGIIRLRLEAGDPAAEEGLRGFIAWKKIRVLGAQREAPAAGPEDMEKKLSGIRAALSKKNTLLITLDAARADHFSAYGYFRPTSPNLERYLPSTTLFTNAYSQSLTTRTSFGTIFTGFPLAVTRVGKALSSLPESLDTLAEHFQSRSFHTQGFTGVGNIGSSFNFQQGFDEYIELYREEGFFRKSQQYLPYVLPWLEANRESPFFLFVHFKEPHAHYVPLPPFLGMFSEGTGKKVDWDDFGKDRSTLSAEEIAYVRAAYDETLASADSAVGEVLDKMDETGLLDETLIIISADHGEMLGEADGVFGHGGYFAKGAAHVPLFIRFPKDLPIDPPQKIEALVKLSDIFATLADIYGFDTPFEFLSGKSLLPLLVAPSLELNPYVVIEKTGTPGSCLRTKRYKLINWHEAPAEFYDTLEDTGELQNIYSPESILANYYKVELKKWQAAQRSIFGIIRSAEDETGEIKIDDIDEDTLENLRTLGYIK
jgi:arylsulfatase A-like enzyme